MEGERSVSFYAYVRIDDLVESSDIGNAIHRVKQIVGQCSTGTLGYVDRIVASGNAVKIEKTREAWEHTYSQLRACMAFFEKVASLELSYEQVGILMQLKADLDRFSDAMDDNSDAGFKACIEKLS